MFSPDGNPPEYLLFATSFHRAIVPSGIQSSRTTGPFFNSRNQRIAERRLRNRGVFAKLWPGYSRRPGPAEPARYAVRRTPWSRATPLPLSRRVA